MVGIGDLPGGDFDSAAVGVTGDGSVVVGSGTSLLGAEEGFRWTQGGGFVALGDLPGGDLGSRAIAVSADGSIVVGTSTTSLGNEAFIWDSATGMRNLREVSGGDAR